jgi:hypothetical protein
MKIIHQIQNKINYYKSVINRVNTNYESQKTDITTNRNSIITMEKIFEQLSEITKFLEFIDVNTRKKVVINE